MIEAEGHLRRCAAGAGEPEDRPRPHVVQPDGGRDRPAQFERPEPAEHPGPHASRAQQIRQAFIPRDGWPLLTADYSQIELRLLAHFCGDETLRTAFAEDRDVHAAVAAQIFKVTEADVTKSQRRMAKTVNFGVIYGMSAAGLSTRLAIPRKEAEEFIDAYFARYPKVLAYQQRLAGERPQDRVRRHDPRPPAAVRPDAIHPQLALPAARRRPSARRSTWRSRARPPT